MALKVLKVSEKPVQIYRLYYLCHLHHFEGEGQQGSRVKYRLTFLKPYLKDKVISYLDYGFDSRDN